MRKFLSGLALIGIITMAGASQMHAQVRADAPRDAQARSERGWLGISFRPEPEIFGDRVFIQDVFPGSPAEAAGLKAGDLVLSWNGSEEIMDQISESDLDPGDIVRFRVRRDGDEHNIRVVAGARPDRLVERIAERYSNMDGFDISVAPLIAFETEDLVNRLGLSADSLAMRVDSMQRVLRVVLRDSLRPQLREMERELARSRVQLHSRARELAREMAQSETQVRARERAMEALGRAMVTVDIGSRGVAGAEFTELNDGLASYFGTDEGVLVIRVSPETPAGRAGLRAGDVILRADDEAIDTVGDLRATIIRARDREIPLQILRQGDRMTLDLRWNGQE
ncbi:MAG TPA: PDZ domain-containing protein [Longimicrobiaceae bacterium]|nr:PDZ domain-containing protein [Longimicrobiaceae bacterium]